MQVGQFTDTLLPIVDGVGRVVYQYATLLAEKGTESYVIAPMQEVEYRGGLSFELIEYAGKRVSFLPQYKAGFPAFDRHYKKRMKNISLDLIHVHAPFSSGLEGARLAKKMGIPLVGTFHSKYYDDFLYIGKRKWLAELGIKYVVKFYNRCDEVWTMNEASAETLREYGYQKKITIVPHGIVQKPLNRAKIASVYHKYYLGSDVPILLFVGQLHFKKNIPLILEACALCQKENVPFQLVFAGKGPHQEKIEALARSLSLSEHIRFTGHIYDEEELTILYHEASLFVFPSLYDTFGLVVQEAALQGTPSVVIKNSAAASAIEDSENGFLCENSAASLAHAIKAALTSDSLENIGINAQTTIPHAWDAIIDTVLENYSRITKKENAIAEENSVREEVT
ncbi:MAG: glycosyltransferase [Christensenellaceae bacterium]